MACLKASSQKTLLAIYKSIKDTHNKMRFQDNVRVLCMCPFVCLRITAIVNFILCSFVYFDGGSLASGDGDGGAYLCFYCCCFDLTFHKRQSLFFPNGNS